ncbi:MAG: ABC transporter ATP-binding protein [Spirochaetaceae bacterium]|nr:ABC transporter ATP-binding protein [Spirochaetaceae bacterium]
MLKICNVSSGYNDAEVIHNISFSAHSGELLCIVGPNGCGKSTLLKTLIRLVPYHGKVFIKGREISSLSRKTLAAHIALLAQSQELSFPYTVRTAVSLGRYAYTQGWFNSLSVADESIVSTVINQLELTAVEQRLITELSGGQLQRVFLARALAQTPDIIVLDEPTNHLDLKHQLDILAFLKVWAKEQHKTAIAVLHDLNLVHQYADTVLVMRDGVIAVSGKPAEVLNGVILKDVYGIDVRGFMLNSLAKWSMMENSTS